MLSADNNVCGVPDGTTFPCDRNVSSRKRSDAVPVKVVGLPARRNRSHVRPMTRGRRAGWWSALRLVVRQARMTGMHSVDYSTLVRLADWRRRPATVWGLLVALASGGRAKCRGGASVPTATAQRAAEPGEPTSQTPVARHRLWRSSGRGRVLSGGPSVLGIRREPTVPYEACDLPGSDLLGSEQ